MRQTKRKQLFTQLYDHTGFERRLGKMALQGWKLERCGSFLGWKFRRIDPAPLVYKVVYFPDASEFDPAPGDRQSEFIELCEQSGWEYIDHTAQMLIFCSRVPDPVPIETDAMMQVETIHKAMKKNWLPGQIGMLALAVLQLLFLLYRLHTELMAVLLSDGLIVSFACYLLMGVLCVHHLCEYFLWRRKALDAAEDGVFVETRGSNFMEQTMLVLLVLIFALWMVTIADNGTLVRVAATTFGAMMLLLAAVNGAKLLMKRLGISAKSNKAATMALVFVGTIVTVMVVTVLGINSFYATDEGERAVDSYEYHGTTHYVYDDPIPLTLEDLGVVADDEYRSRTQKVQTGLLVAQYIGEEIVPDSVRYGEANLYYTITVPRFGFLVDPCAESVLEQQRTRVLYGAPQPTDPSLWGAQRVYEHIDDNGATGYYTVVYADRIVVIKLPHVPTTEQIVTAAAVLKNFVVK